MATKDSRTLTQLQDEARQLGLTGYSKLNKSDLLAMLKKASKPTPQPKKPATVKKTPAAKKVTSKKKTSTKAVTARSPVTKKSVAVSKTDANKTGSSVTRKKKVSVAKPKLSTGASHQGNGTREQLIENTKYLTSLPGVIHENRRFLPDLLEDIETMPPLTANMLMILPQKPGVLYAYWNIDASLSHEGKPIMLRLCQIDEHKATILLERPVQHARGEWYFQLDPAADVDHVYLQLGHYNDAGDFILAMRHAIVRVPRLTSPRRIDRRWWLSDEEFALLYRRAGGLIKDGSYLWPGYAMSSR